jgi:aldehyde dehydrogenase (NAD+)
VDSTLQLLVDLGKLGREFAKEEQVENGKIRKLPLGVSLMFPYYSSPIQSSLMLAWPALLMGNACILKPSSLSPWVGPYLASVMKESTGLDLLQSCFPDQETLLQMLRSKDIRQISYMGSRQGGKLMYEKVAEERFINMTLFYNSKTTGYVDCSGDLAKAAEQVAF